MSLYLAIGSETTSMSPEQARAALYEALGKLGDRKKVLAVPPDFTRFHSKAGEFTRYAYDYYGDKLTDILPALGTHTPVTPHQLEVMFPGVPQSLFRPHRWRTDIVTLGTVPSEFLQEQSEGKLDYD